MNPLQMLLMAARGHVGLPSTVTHAAPAAPASSPGGAGADRQVAQQTAGALIQAAHTVTDPQLQAVFSSALAALHKYLAADQKEQHQALAGKLSPRLMAQSVGR